MFFKKKCPNCGANNPKDSVACAECGAPFEPSDVPLKKLMEPELADALCRSLQAWGIRAEVVDRSQRYTVGWGGLNLSYFWEYWYYIQLEDRNIDRVEVTRFRVGGIGGVQGDSIMPYWCVRLRYCISDEMQRAGDQVRVGTSVEEKGFFSPKVIDFHWVGAALADLLNADAELKRVLLEMGETLIRIEAANDDKCVRIFAPGWHQKHFKLPSRELFEAYERIAGHVRTPMAL